MKRSLYLMATLSVLLLCACQKKNQEAASRVEEPYVPLEHNYTPPPVASHNPLASSEPLTVSDTTGYDQTPTDTTSDEVLSPSDTAGTSTYTVQKGDTLYKLARQFYNDQARWKDIWEANRARLSDPNKLSVGMKLIIP